ncbi:M14 family metallopeptidase [Haloferula sargassicola]|uniref:Peptidase M14 domain-containing protein n=1 Tax=Haloferula sargassicola TaxID=490096 RepID=A0ABP9UIS0_9BACT
MSPFDPAAFLQQFQAEAESRGLRSLRLAETSHGPVMAFVSAEPENARYLSAGIHGDEPAGPLAALELLRGGVLDAGWIVCPALNPTGLAAGTRENADGLDLNRDYLRLETPEVRAHATWLESLTAPRAFVSLHEDWESSGFYFYEINLGDDRPARAHGILEAVAPWFPAEPEASIDDHETREPGWIYHEAEADLPDHWPEAIYLAKRGCPISFTFETPSSAELAKRVAAHVAAFKAAMA